MLAAVTRKNDSTPPSATPTEGGRSFLAAVGEEGRRSAQKTALLAACRASGWNLPVAAKALGTHRGNMSNLLDDLAPAEYAAAKAEGLIAHGPKPAKKNDRE